MKLFSRLLIPLVAIALLSAGCQTRSINVDLKTSVDSLSYALGVNIASSVEDGNFEEINPEAIAMGLLDFFSSKGSRMTNEEAITFIREFMTREAGRVATKNKAEGLKFLEENADKEGVIVHESGMQYKVLVEGDGPKPSETDKVRVHYHGTRIDGSVFDSSVERDDPAEFALNRVIKGWTIGVQLMPVGSKYIFYIPADLAYGSNPRPGGPVQPNDLLIFEVELLDIIK